MSATKLLVLITTTLACLCLGVAPPASAATIVRNDARGDAPAIIDVTRAAYTHGPGRVSVVARIPELGRAGTAALSISRFEVFEAGYVVEIRKRVGERPRTRLLFFDHFDTTPRRCDGVRGTWRWDLHRITLSVPRACLDGHRRERVFAQFGIQRGQDVDRAPAVRRLARG